MWEIATIVEVLERKGLCTKQDLYDIDREAIGVSSQGREPVPPAPSNDQIIPITESSIHIRIHATPDTPDMGGEVGLTVSSACARTQSCSINARARA